MVLLDLVDHVGLVDRVDLMDRVEPEDLDRLKVLVDQVREELGDHERLEQEEDLLQLPM